VKIRDRIKELRRVKANELIPNPANWRTHPKSQMDAIRGVLAEVGFAGAELAYETDRGLMLIDGHARAEIAGDAEIPVLILDVNEAEAKKILATFDPIGAMADADAVKLDSLLREVETGNQALADMLTALAEDNGVLAGLKDSAEVIEDEVPEPPADPITKPNDLWILGRHRLLCGDSTKADDVARLMDGANAEMMFTDPPYGVNYEGGHFHSGDVNIKRKREKLAADATAQIYFDFLPVALSVVDGPCYMWFAGSKARDVYNAVHESNCEVHALIIWHKTNATYAAMNAQYKQRHEPCLYFKPKGSTLRWCGETTEATVWSQDRDGINEFHPTQKPVALAAKAIGNHEAAKVLDMFCGSGSTLIAAEQLGRTCYGMEISPQYCDVIVKRWENLTGEKAELWQEKSATSE
jgi:DNA modification methylase